MPFKGFLPGYAMTSLHEPKIEPMTSLLYYGVTYAFDLLSRCERKRKIFEQLPGTEVVRNSPMGMTYHSVSLHFSLVPAGRATAPCACGETHAHDLWAVKSPRSHSDGLMEKAHGIFVGFLEALEMWLRSVRLYPRR